MEGKLKPCPFCGSSPKFTEAKTSKISNAFGVFAVEASVECPQCGCRLGGKHLPACWSLGPTRNQLEFNNNFIVDKWNSRVDTIEEEE